MDSSLSIQVKHESLNHTHHEASSPYLTTHGQGPTQGDMTDSIVRNNDNRIFISSLSTKSPLHLASSENRSTQSAPLGSDQRHTDSPLFAKPEVCYEVTGVGRYIAQPILDAKLRKGLERANVSFVIGTRITIREFKANIRTRQFTTGPRKDSPSAFQRAKTYKSSPNLRVST